MSDSDDSDEKVRRALTRIEEKRITQKALKHLLAKISKKKKSKSKKRDRKRYQTSSSSSSSDSDSYSRARRRVRRGKKPRYSPSPSEDEGGKESAAASDSQLGAAGDGGGGQPPLSPGHHSDANADDDVEVGECQPGDAGQAGDVQHPPSPGHQSDDVVEIEAGGSMPPPSSEPQSGVVGVGSKVPLVPTDDSNEIICLKDETVNNRQVVTIDDSVLEVTISQRERQDLEGGLGEGGSAQPAPPPRSPPHPPLPPPPPTEPAIIQHSDTGPLLCWNPLFNSFTIAKRMKSLPLDSIQFNIDAIRHLSSSLTPCVPFQTGHCGKSSLIHVGKGPSAANEFAHICHVCLAISGLPLSHNMLICPHCKQDQNL